jgi:hypothetical protein
MPINISILRELPKDVNDKLFNVIKSKLPVEVDDAVINDIITTNYKIVKEYLETVN